MNSQFDSNPLLGFLKRRQFALAAVFVVAAVGAYFAANKFSAQSWSCAATLLYNRSARGEPYYRQPEPQSIVSLFKSRAALESLAREFKLPPHLAAIAGSIQAEILYDSNTLQVTLRGGDPQQTRAMLERLIQLVIGQAAQLRRDALASILEDRKKNLAEAKLAVEQSFRDLDRFRASHKIVTDVEDDLDRVRDDIVAAERATEIDRPALLNSQDDLQRRRSALQEHLTLQRDAIARESALALKKSEYERAVRLHEKRYISDAEFGRAESEYRTLEAQNAAALRSSQERLSQVDRKLNERLEQNGGSLVGGAEVDSPQAVATAARLKAFLAQRQAEAERLSLLRGQEADLRQAVTTSQAEVQRLTAAVTQFQEFRAAAFDDLTIVQPAAPALDPLTSNKKKILIGAFLALLGLGLTPVLAWDAVQQSRRPSAAGKPGAAVTFISRILPLNMISAGPIVTNRRETVRTIALRIQQLPTPQGAVVLLNRLDDLAPPIDAALETAECLNRRGEKVLVIDLTGEIAATTKLHERTAAPSLTNTQVFDDWTRPAASSRTFSGLAADDERGNVATIAATTTAGLVELLLDEELELEQVIRRGTAFDALTLGQADLPEEAFAGRRLTALFDELRNRYGDVLVLGPGVVRQVDLELLAARADGLVFITEPGRSTLPAGEQAWADLIALKAPLLGRFEV